ncbi:DegT/DnrJ/EryC1/StrS family aminotransferase [Catellatospora methionotrophica]|uniref:DegT/DnrJ/EryC1/StrS family aminotransferase n=1 Tax=Catellatospora methionotrophica TaxID=121620 RepID=UPI0033C0E2C7
MTVSVDSKRYVEDFALFGGRPAFATPLVVGRPNVGSRERFIARVNEILDRHQLSNDGPMVKLFEQQIAEHLQVRYCVATANATVGLQLVTQAASLKGEVIMPALTFVATAHAVSWVGLKPVFCDVDPTSGNIDLEHAKSLVTPATSAIIAVHLWGRPCEAARLEQFAAESGLRLIFDAAHAFGCTHAGRKVGNFGDAEVFSFHATKVVNCFEGGAVVTNDQALAASLRRLRNFGMDEHRAVLGIGTNAKMSEVSAAMGVTSLESFPLVLARNAENFRAYRRHLSGAEKLRLIEPASTEQNNFSYVVVQLGPGAGVSRDLMLAVLRAENIAAQAYFSPGLHRLEPYGHVHSDLPVTDSLAASVIALPTGPSTSLDDVAKVCGVLNMALRHGAEMTRLAGGKMKSATLDTAKLGHHQ